MLTMVSRFDRKSEEPSFLRLVLQQVSFSGPLVEMSGKAKEWVAYPNQLFIEIQWPLPKVCFSEFVFSKE